MGLAESFINSEHTSCEVRLGDGSASERRENKRIRRGSEEVKNSEERKIGLEEC